MKVKVGVIGCGSIARWSHLPAYAALAKEGQVEIIGVCDPVAERVEEMGQKYHAQVYSDYHDLLSNPEIGAVSVCSPNYLHAPVSIEALNSGKHVLCEKPMATSEQEAISMIAASGKTSRKLMIAQSQRYAAAHLKAKEILLGGTLGQVITFDTAFCHSGPEGWCADKSNKTWFFNKKAAVFGAMGDLGIHKADLIQYLLNEKVIEVAAFVETKSKHYDDGKQIEVDDNAVCILKTESGIVGKLTASWTEPVGEINATRLVCEKGMIRIYDDPQFAIIVNYVHGETIFYKLDSVFNNEKPKPSPVITAFVDSIFHDSPVPISGEEGLQALKVILACIESSKTKKIIKIT